jgi:hypothetical protein
MTPDKARDTEAYIILITIALFVVALLTSSHCG